MGRSKEIVGITDKIFNWSLAFCTAAMTISFVTYLEGNPVPALIIGAMGLVSTTMTNILAGLIEKYNIQITGKEWLNLDNLYLLTRVATGVFGLAAVGLVTTFILK